MLSRALGRGGGTVLPGHVIQRLDPSALQAIARRLPRGSVVISGTNGKTTTSRMIAHIASRTGVHVIHNRSGANLMTGIVSAIAAQTALSGRPRGDLGLFEVDEAHVAEAVDSLRPRCLALLNIFRDQLDRYGEIDLISSRWRKAVGRMPYDGLLVLNADDPIISRLADDASCRVVTFGVEDPRVGGGSIGHDADRRLCPNCGHRLRYARVTYAHLGAYECTECGWRRRTPETALTSVRAEGSDDMLLTISTDADAALVCLSLPGLYNAYNALAAAAICEAVGIPLSATAENLSTFTGAFGRYERVPIGAGEVRLALVKNPVGFNQVLAAGIAGQATTIVIAINDHFADGTDISWLWDVDFEVLDTSASGADTRPHFVCSGTRAHDIALRLKYAGLATADIEVEPRLEFALRIAVEDAEGGGRAIIFPTYTAMLDVRRSLQRRGSVAPFWED
ncbi:MAG: UDP-N-acetylmuramyl tripeptide synthase [Chloroflexi bacterium]|nr:UDP-N-acetylmuramyl tripeptide synthase [Chloroflexota bacterium]